MHKEFDKTRFTRSVYRYLATLLVLSFALAPLNAFASTALRERPREALGEPDLRIATSPIPMPAPLQAQAPYGIAPSSGVQGKEYEVIVTSNQCLQGASKNPMKDFQLHAPDGSGITVVSLKQIDCQLTAKLSIAPDAPLGAAKLWLVKANQKEVPTIDFIVTGVLPQPIPPGLNNQGQVDVMWSVLPDKITKDNFGGKVANQFYCIEAVIGNDSGYDLQIASIGFTLPKLANGKYKIPSTGYRSVRGSLEAFGQVSPRRFVMQGFSILGPLLTGFIPFFHVLAHKANFSEAINIISNPLEKGVENFWPDLLPMELDRLADQTFRDDISTKTIIPNNVQSRIVTFVPRRLVFPNKPKDGEPDPRKNPQSVMEELGQIVIVGDQITHVNRVRVVNNPFGASITDHSISGKVTDACGTGVAGVTITLSASGFVSRPVNTDTDGNYTLANVPDGRTYTVSAKLNDVTFSPASSNPFPLNDTKTNLNFSTGYLIAGKITSKDGKALEEEISVKLSGGGLANAMTVNAGSDGGFMFEVPAKGATPNFKITVSPTKYTVDGASTADWSCDKRDVSFVVIKKQT